MSGLFDPKNGVWRTVSALGDILGLSVLWAALCLPVVTIGPATAALYFAVSRYVRPRQDGAYAAFFRSFRQNLKVGIITTLIALAVAAVIVESCWLLLQYANGGVTAAVPIAIAAHIMALLAMGVLCYVFPVLGRFEHSVGSLLRVSFALALSHLPTTLVLALLHLEMITTCYRYWWPILFVPALTALLSSLFLERVFQKHMPPEEPEEEEKLAQTE